ncbi:hypothetical protein BV20DRAFT_109785 [Pilatotrama ljubarskyi]|nr:hypothetical protein BV20DRAFT_109785 [Pilatotrama ljubarskyi]
MNANAILPVKWMIPAIVSNIVLNIPLSSRDFDYKTLLALSVTCRALSRPALDQIWHTLPSLIPLVRTLPCDLWTEVAECPDEDAMPNAGARKYIEFKRPLEITDVARLLAYASRVKRICSAATDGAFENVSLSPDAYAALERLAVASLSLPNLRSLEIDCHPRCLDAVPLHVFNFPMLQRLNFSWRPLLLDHFEGRVYSFFKVLEGMSPQLTHMHLHIDDCPIAIRQAVQDAAGSMSQLKVFGWSGTPNMSPVTLCKLSQLPRLSTLEIGISGKTTAGTALFPELPAGCFAALESLQLTTDALAWTHDLIYSMKFDGLRSLSVHLTGWTSASALEAFFIALCGRLPGLASLDITLPEDVVLETFPAHTMYPLLRLRRLTSLHMDSCPIAVDDTLVRAMSLAWPGLHDICIPIDVPRYPSLVSLSALVHLATNCEQLYMLGLPLDAETVPPRLRTAQDVGLGQYIERPISLQVGRSKVGAPKDVATYLSDLFPNLHCVDSRWEYDLDILDDEGEDEVLAVSMAREYHSRWHRVEKLMKELWRIKLWVQKTARVRGCALAGRCVVLAPEAAERAERQRRARVEEELEEFLCRGC